MPVIATSRRDLNRVERVVRLRRGQALFFEGDGAEAYYAIERGTVRCCRMTPDGRRQIFRFAGAGDLLGVGCVTRHGYAAEAVTELVARRHPMAGLEAEMADATLRNRVLEALRAELAATRTQLMLLGRMSASEKLANFLLNIAAERRSGLIELPMGRADIADYLGLTIETVSRKLNALHALGVIRMESPTRIAITDPGRIEAIAEAA